jgi:hypothetical protein
MDALGASIAQKLGWSVHMPQLDEVVTLDS